MSARHVPHKPLHTHKKRPTYTKRDLHAQKETYMHKKRPTYTKRDLHTQKETYIHKKRSTHTKRDLHTQKETYIHKKKPAYTIRDRPTLLRAIQTLKRALHKSHHMSARHVPHKPLHTHKKRSTYTKRDLYTQKPYTSHITHMSHICLRVTNLRQFVGYTCTTNYRLYSCLSYIHAWHAHMDTKMLWTMPVMSMVTYLLRQFAGCPCATNCRHRTCRLTVRLRVPCCVRKCV